MQAGAAEWEQCYWAQSQQLSKQFLRPPENVLCAICEAVKQASHAEVVGRIIPHRGDQALFWDPANWQGLCRSHHSRDKQVEERGFRKRRRIGVDGYPIE